MLKEQPEAREVIFEETSMKTWHQVAVERGMPDNLNGSISSEDYRKVGVYITNGCPCCGATVAPYNSFQRTTDNPYAYCRECV